MLLCNLSTKKTVFKNIVKAQGLVEETVGMIGKNKNCGMYLETRWGIHTFGMKFPLTIIVCDSTLVVQAIKWNLPPNRVYFWKPRWSNIFELPAGKYPVSIGDKLELIT